MATVFYKLEPIFQIVILNGTHTQKDEQDVVMDHPLKQTLASQGP